MICGTYTMTKVPDAEVNAVVAGFNATKPLSKQVTKTADGPGTWTVVAQHDSCAANVTHSTGN